MGRRGPAPTPTAVLRLRGSWRGELNKSEPEPGPGRPRCPSWLDSEGKAVWRNLVPVLEEMGVLTRADANALARYCVTWVRWRRAEEFIARYGNSYPIKDERGQVRCFAQFPEVGISNKLALTLRGLEAEFGLTPSARSRISVEVGPPREDAIEAFLREGAGG